MTDKPTCASCDFMRHEGAVMRCYWEAPQPVFLGASPGRIAGGPPALVITGMSPEVTAERFCRHHPELRMEGEVRASPGISIPTIPSPKPPIGILLDGSETRQ